jgi:hypothetical protein
MHIETHPCVFLTPEQVALARVTRVARVRARRRADVVSCEALEEQFEPEYVLDVYDTVILFSRKPTQS